MVRSERHWRRIWWEHRGSAFEYNVSVGQPDVDLGWEDEEESEMEDPKQKLVYIVTETAEQRGVERGAARIQPLAA